MSTEPEYHDGLPVLPPAKAASATDKLRIQIIGIRAGWSAWAAKEAGAAAAEGGRDASDERWGALMAVDAALRNAESEIEWAIERITKEATGMARTSPVPARRCICGPDSTGENPDSRPGCPVHGAHAPYDAAASDIGEDPF